MHAIDYGHIRDGVLYHGSISTLDGPPRCTWTYELDGRKVTREEPIDRATFESLWNGIVDLDVFRRSKVRDPQQKIDPAGFHVLGIVYGEKDQPKRKTFLVPADENDPEFLRWLAALNVPQGSAGPPRSEGVQGASRLAAEREKIYPSLFGKEWRVVSEPAEEGPPIDVYLFAPGGQTGEERDFFTLVTGGLSDERMKLPEGSPFRRAELVLYVDEPSERHVALLLWLASLPLVQEKTWYGPGTTMTNGNPPQPIFDGSSLDCYLFLYPIVADDAKVHERLTLEGDPTALLWVVPITSAERQFIIDRQLPAFLDVLNKNEHPFWLDEGRKSYV